MTAATVAAWVIWTLAGLYLAWGVHKLVRDIRRAKARARADIAAAKARVEARRTE